MFGKVSDDSFTHIFDLSLDSEDRSFYPNNSYGSNNKMGHSSNSSSPLSSRRDFSSSPSTPSSASSLPLEAAFSQFAASFSSLLTDKESAASVALNLDKKISELERLRNKIHSGSSDSHSSASSTTSSGTSGQSKVNTSRYKTELCRPFSEHGTCKYGEKCQFAHGQGDLRSVTRHPKYKTELCRTYHSVGFCPYGPRCHFVHNLDEADTHPSLIAGSNTNQSQNQQAQKTNLNGILNNNKQPIGSGRIPPHNLKEEMQQQQQQHQQQKQIKPLPMFDNMTRQNQLGGDNQQTFGWNPLNSSLFNGEQQQTPQHKPRLPVFSTLSK